MKNAVGAGAGIDKQLETRMDAHSLVLRSGLCPKKCPEKLFLIRSGKLESTLNVRLGSKCANEEEYLRALTLFCRCAALELTFSRFEMHTYRFAHGRRWRSFRRSARLKIDAQHAHGIVVAQVSRNAQGLQDDHLLCRQAIVRQFDDFVLGKNKAVHVGPRGRRNCDRRYAHQFRRSRWIESGLVRALLADAGQYDSVRELPIELLAVVIIFF